MTNRHALQRVIDDYQRAIDDYRATIQLLANERAVLDAMYQAIGEQVNLLNTSQAYALQLMEQINAEDSAGEEWKTGNGENSDA